MSERSARAQRVRCADRRLRARQDQDRGHKNPSALQKEAADAVESDCNLLLSISATRRSLAHALLTSRAALERGSHRRARAARTRTRTRARITRLRGGPPSHFRWSRETAGNQPLRPLRIDRGADHRKFVAGQKYTALTLKV